MIDLAKFTLEEYKATQTKINQNRNILARLETFTIGGTVVAVGFLLGIGHTQDAVPVFAWFALAFIVAVAGARCWSYYIYIWHLRTYVMKIEQSMKDEGYKLDGVETFSQGKWLVRLYQVMAVLWAVVIVALFVVAIFKSFGANRWI